MKLPKITRNRKNYENVFQQHYFRFFYSLTTSKKNSRFSLESAAIFANEKKEKTLKFIQMMLILRANYQTTINLLKLNKSKQ